MLITSYLSFRHAVWADIARFETLKPIGMTPVVGSDEYVMFIRANRHRLVNH